MVTDTNLFLIPLHAFLRSKTRYLSRSDDREAMSALRLRIGGFPSPTRSPVAPGEDADKERDDFLNDIQSGTDIYLPGMRIEGGNVSPQGPQRAHGARGQHEGRPASSIQRQVSAHDEQGREYPHDPP